MILPYLLPLLPYMLLTLLIAYMGQNTKFGFWGNFWISLLLTPIVGIVVLVAQDSRPPKPSRTNSRKFS